MATNTDGLRCTVCHKLYTNPVIHRPCQLSFDRQCVHDRCPGEKCGRKINEADLIVNRDLLDVVNEYRLKLETPLTYYLVLLDTSSSMWYSDAWLPFAIGRSRFSCALEFLNNFFKLNLNSTTEKVSLVTFDTSTLQRFGFDTLTTKHLKVLQNLKCEGKDTALFDSIDFCFEIFEKITPSGTHVVPRLYFLIVTDGGNNFGKEESKYAEKVAYRSGQLQIFGHVIQVRDKNRKATRSLCEVIKYKFSHFHSGNVREFADSFPRSIKPENQVLQTASFMDLLPEVPTEPIEPVSKEKTLA